MNTIGFNVRKIREMKGYSQDYMAQELEISQASYARLESEETKLSIYRLLKIAEILKTDINEFFGESTLIILNQTNNEGAYGNGYVQNLHVENKEIYEKLILAQKGEISFLKSLLQKNNL